ncbi:MAG: hemerythrin domain-containing protein [Elusimicrobia bacterium]|nr:hemerythrin domain-containing protein [Elusimicrobiota bacterium]
MDVIEKLVAQHTGIKEQLDILNKLIRMIDSDAFIWDNVVKVSDFFNREARQHFILEERVLFPVLKKVLPQDKQKILTEIELEHRPILDKLVEFEKIAKKHSKLQSYDSRENFIKTSHDIIESLISHAKKEDEKLFPLIKSLFKPENYREFEDLYFKYLEV